MSSKVINLTTDGKSKSGKRAKSASPTLGSSSQSTSIIDNILKDRAATSQGGKASPGKKLIIDLAKDNFIITDAKPTNNDNLNKPQAIKPLVSKPIDRVVFDIPSPTTKHTKDGFDLDMDIPSSATSNSKKTGRKSPAPAAGSLGNSAVSREKMDKLKALDAVFLNSTPSPEPTSANLGYSVSNSKPKSSDPLDFVFEGLPTPRKSPSPIQIMPSQQTNHSYTEHSRGSPDKSFDKPISKSNDIKIIKSIGTSNIGPSTAFQTATPSSIIDTNLTRQKLDTVNRNIAKIQSKIHEKGAKEKYAVMLKDLEKQKQKYESRLADGKAPRALPQPVTQTGNKSPIPIFSPPSYQESMLGQQTDIQLGPPTNINHETSKLIGISSSNDSPRTSPVTKSPITIKNIADEEKLATDKELARIRELFPEPKTVTGIGHTKQNQRPKEVQSLFNVSNNLETLREKQKHLEQQHKKLEEQYAHKMKQIDLIRNQKEEMTKLSALEHERRKIYEMEQKLKRLDKEQWEEQQRLRRELQTINIGNLKTISNKNNRDVGEFYSLKQQLADRSTAISPVNTPRATDTPFRLVDWFAGFMSNKLSNQQANKKYQPESFKEVELGLKNQGPTSKNNKPILGYHYYNIELPSTAWSLEEETSADEFRDYQLGSGQICAGIIAYINTVVNDSNESIQPLGSVVDNIEQLSTQLGCTNTINIAKCLDFIIDKLDTRPGVQLNKRSKLLELLTRLLKHTTDRLSITIIST